MDISTLSKQLNMSVAQLRSKINQAGFRVSPKANKIDNQMAKQILNSLSQKAQVQTAPKEAKEVALPNVMSVKELAQILGLDVTVVIKKLIQNGVLASINEEIDYDTGAIVASDLGFIVSEVKKTTTRLGLGYVNDAVMAEKKEKPTEFIPCAKPKLWNPKPEESRNILAHTKSRATANLLLFWTLRATKHSLQCAPEAPMSRTL
jgi:hypothetical protein